ncbi:MAG TPA: hypothetical protein VM325_04805 [Alphaproteobacteria bacterium]|nr:hypothetical protein [Alphaproteobacteria bacterium]
MLKKLTIVLGMAVAVAGTTTVSSFVFVPEAQALGIGSIKKVGKKVGRAAKKGGKFVGRKAKKGGKAIGRKAKKGGKFVGRKTWKGGKFVGRKAEKGGKAVGRGAKRAGRAIKSYAKCVKQGGCGRIGDLPPGTKGNPRPAVRINRSRAPVTAHRS